MKLVVWLIYLLAMPFAAFGAALPEPPSIGPADLPALMRKLKSGGHVLYFRHLETRLDQEDRYPVDLNHCGSQRNLSDAGRALGGVIARAFRSQAVPVGEVVSSPFCRTVESARIIFGKTETDADLFFAIALTEEGKKRKGAALRALLTRVPARGTNAVIVGHTANLQEAVGLWPKPEGVAYVFRPDGKGGLEAVARIAPEAWKAVAG